MSTPESGERTRVVYVQRQKRMGCCSVLVLIIAGFWLLGNAKDWWGAFQKQQEESERVEKQEKSRAAIQEDIERFAAEQAPGVQRALDELALIQERDRTRMEKLAQTLEALGRNPEEDPDWLKLRDRQGEIEGKRDDLARRLEDAFLKWQKFLISQDPAEQKRYEDALREGEVAAGETSKRLEELLEESANGG